MNKKTILFFILLVSLVGHSFLSAQSRAIVKEITGKVEVKLPNRDWAPASVGLPLPAGTIISTGFKSSAVIEMDASVLTVKQLTRLTLEELFRKDNEVNTRVYLRAGTIEADVKPTEGLTHNYRLRSPVTTASVRGTRFPFEIKRLFVKKGIVVLSNLINRQGTAGEGEGVWTTTGLDMHTAEEEAFQRAEVEAFTSGSGGSIPFIWFRYKSLRWPSLSRGGGVISSGTTSSTVIFELEW
jgi:hypothetical protein